MGLGLGAEDIGRKTSGSGLGAEDNWVGVKRPIFFSPEPVFFSPLSSAQCSSALSPFSSARCFSAL
ncbi:MAG TPA: hypothetical protein PLU80_06085, partial [Acidobacteriota bacterium]|nr:hypothetical protein [Acidobacteriota bacterium]